MKFILILIITWLLNGSIKFIINLYTSKNNALTLIGYGGFPSTHSAIISSFYFYAGFNYGFNNIIMIPLLVTFWIVINDALNLRKYIGLHAKSLNKLDPSSSHRERIGHKYHEVLGGILVGLISSIALTYLLKI